MQKLLIAAMAGSALISAPALAATDGALSSISSTGTVNVGTYIPRLVKISGLKDIKIHVQASDLLSSDGSANTGGSQSKTDNFCVYSNVGRQGRYSISVSGPTDNSGFALHGAHGHLPFRVIFGNPTNVFIQAASSGTPYDFNTAVDNHGRRKTVTCDEGMDATLFVGINDTDIFAAESGYYKGTLTVTVAPI